MKVNNMVDILKQSLNKVIDEAEFSQKDKVDTLIKLRHGLKMNIKVTSEDKRDIYFDIMNESVLWRAQTLFTKEPETIKWINSFNEKDVFWDIGANVGVFTLYAGVRGHRTLAFEPSSANYYSLNQNILMNQIDKHVSAYCIAFSNDESLGTMELQGLTVGGALHSFSKENQEGYFHHGAFSMSIDKFIEIYNPEFPNQLKIDVDGLEALIISGARNTLKDQRLKSILVEIDRSNEDELEGIHNIILESGFVLQEYTHAPEFDNTVHKDVYNHIYVREA